MKSEMSREAIPGVTIYGITDRARFDQRVPTIAFRLDGYSPREVAEQLGRAGIFVWDGNYYALAVTERLGVEESGGLVRVGIAHYNTEEEVDRLLAVVNALAHRDYRSTANVQIYLFQNRLEIVMAGVWLGSGWGRIFNV